MRPGKRKAMDKSRLRGAIVDQLAQQVKARMRAKVEHPFRVIKSQFGHVKVSYRGLAKNTAQLHMLFTLSNLWMARGKLLWEMSASAGRQRDTNEAKSALKLTFTSWKPAPAEIECVNSRCGGR